MKIKTTLKKQKGSIAVYVSIVLLSMVVVLSAMFMILTSTRKRQLTTAMKLKETYEADNKNASNIYKALLKKMEPDQKEFEFAYTGAMQTFTAPADGIYKLQVWGAQGGSYNSSYGVGGKGGYSEGNIKLTEGTKLYVYVGGQGGYGTTTTYNVQTGGGYNGGGDAAYRGGAGGGATDIRIDGNTYYYRVIVAGGGGGAYSYNSTYKANGGVGGGNSGINGKVYSTSYNAFKGMKGTQTSGGKGGTGSTSSYNGSAGTFGEGGSTGRKYNSTSYYSNGAGGRRMVWRRSSRQL